MNNELKNKTKQQLISEINKLRMLNDEQYDKLREVNVNYARTRQENKNLKENLELADSECQELRLRYQMQRANANDNYRRLLVWFTFSVLFNVSLIAIIVMLLNR